GRTVVRGECASPPTCHLGQVRPFEAIRRAIRHTCGRLKAHLQGIRMKNKKQPPPQEGGSQEASKRFSRCLRRLQEILKPYEKQFSVVPYKPEFYYLQTRSACHEGKPVWFAVIRMGKNYVSYRLMPVYMNRVSQKRISPELKKRMQGKACFNFSG
ncbi:MAG: hypothetical protein DMG50_30400, partial [Acidobacteria bacterium]